MCLVLEQILWGHSSRVCDISCLKKIPFGIHHSVFWCVFFGFKCVLSGLHHTPSVFAHGSGSVSRSTSDFRSRNGTCSNTRDELGSHFRAYIPAVDNN